MGIGPTPGLKELREHHDAVRRAEAEVATSQESYFDGDSAFDHSQPAVQPTEEGEEEEQVIDRSEDAEATKEEDGDEDPKGEQEETTPKDSLSSGTAASEETKWEDAEVKSKEENSQRIAEEQISRQDQVVDAELDKVDRWYQSREMDESQGSQSVMDGHRGEERDTLFTLEAELAHREAAEAYGQNTDNEAVNRGVIPLQCATDGCRRTPWNSQHGQTCCRSCPQSNGKAHGQCCDKWLYARKDGMGATDTESVKRKCSGRRRTSRRLSLKLTPDMMPLFKVPVRTWHEWWEARRGSPPWGYHSYNYTIAARRELTSQMR
jgi:hypothetical protein